MQLETERLLLRPFTMDDFYDVYSYSSVLQNVYFMEWGPSDEAATKDFLLRCENHWKVTPVTHYDFAIIHKELDKVIGGCGVYLSEGRQEGMLGWILHRSFWKKGYGTEMGKALLKFGFEDLNLHHIYAECNTDNYGSYRVMENIGMRREAHFVQNKFGRVGGKQTWYDQYHYGILNDEWQNKSNN